MLGATQGQGASQEVGILDRAQDRVLAGSNTASVEWMQGDLPVPPPDKENISMAKLDLL